MICRNCGSDCVATSTAQSSSLELCDACQRYFDLMENYERRLVQLAEALASKDYQSALEVLNRAEVELLHLDATGWLSRTILADRGMVLQEQGRWQDALVSYEARLQLPFSDPAENAVTLLSGARMLLRLGRQTEALAHMNAAVDCLKDAHPQAALPMLLTWLDEGQHTIFLGRESLVESALRAYSLDFPGDVSKDPVGALLWAKANWVR